MLRCLCLCLCLCLSLVLATLKAGEALPRPDIPDPFGLGERLALIDHLKEGYRVTPPTDATYEQLVALYWQKAGKRDDVGKDDEAAVARDRLQRLRSELAHRHDLVAPLDADEDTLRRLLAQARQAGIRQATEATAAQVQADAQRIGLTATEAGNLQARTGRIGAEVAQTQERIAAGERERARIQEEARACVARKVKLDTKIEAALAERNRWTKAMDNETRAGHAASSATRSRYEQAKQNYTAAVDLAKAESDQVQLLKQRFDALVEEQKRLQERITALDQEQVDATERLAKHGPAIDASLGTGRSGVDLEARLRSAVVLVQVEGRGTGTGFFISRDGLLITNAHVVGDGTGTITARWDSAAHQNPLRLHPLRILKEDDLALLRAEGAAGISGLELTEIYELSRPLLAVGFPLAGNISRSLGTSPTDIVVSKGTLSATRRQGERVEWLQHDCRIASGNSGGPLIDQSTGAVVGVNTMILVPGQAGGSGDGMNFAIPAWKVRARFGSLLTQPTPGR